MKSIANAHPHNDPHQAIREVEGVFPEFVNASAFFDVVMTSVWGKLRETFLEPVKVTGNLAIGGRDRTYSRALHGIHAPSGNAFELRYGPLRHYKTFPSFRLIMRAREMPVTGAQSMSMLDSLFEPGFSKYVSQVEFTFDISHVSVLDLYQRLFTRARCIRAIPDELHPRTVYIGSPKSSWQLRIYEKTHSTTRVEWVFRRAFLKAHKIQEPHDLYLLSGMNLWDWVSFRFTPETDLNTVVNGIADGWRKQALIDWPRKWAYYDLAKILTRYRIDPDLLLRTSDVQGRLQPMQKRMLW